MAPAGDMRVAPCDTRRARSPCAVAAGPRAWILALPRLSRRPHERVQNQRPGRMQMKGSQKPKKLGKKPAQKTLKERRTAKRAAAKHASRGLDV